PCPYREKYIPYPRRGRACRSPRRRCLCLQTGSGYDAEFLSCLLTLFLSPIGQWLRWRHRGDSHDNQFSAALVDAAWPTNCDQLFRDDLITARSLRKLQWLQQFSSQVEVLCRIAQDLRILFALGLLVGSRRLV